MDSSTIARFRAMKPLDAAVKGYWEREGKSVSIKFVADVSNAVLAGGNCCGIVPRTGFGAICDAAVSQFGSDLPSI